MANGDCTVGAEVRTDIRNIKDTLAAHHEEDESLWRAIERIEHRLPVWATFTISGLTGVIGVLVTLLVGR